MEPTKDLENQASPLSMNRRDFLRLAGAAVGVIASACAPNPTPESGKALATVIDLVTATSLPVEPTKEPTPKPTPEVKPTYTPLPPTPEKVATPTAEAFNVMKIIEEAAQVAVGGGTFGVWPEEMEEKVAPNFVPDELDPVVTPIKFGGETKILVSPDTKKAGAVLIPWQSDQESWQEGKPSETLALFGALLPKELDGNKIEYLPDQDVNGEPEKLHLAVYKNGQNEIEALVVPFVTEETAGKEAWTKILALKTAGTLGNVITGIETIEINGKAVEKPVMIFLDKNGNELLRADLRMVSLEKAVKAEELGKIARFEVGKGQYTFYGEDAKEIPEKAIKLWEVPQELPTPIPTATETPEKPEARIVFDKLNVRNGPGTEYDVISNFNQDARVEVVSQYNGWYKVRWLDKEGKEQIGWVSAGPKYIEANEAAKRIIEEPKEKIPPTPTARPTPEPTATKPAPTEQPLPPEAQAGQICGVGRSAGKCYERTEKRKGAPIEGDGMVARYYPDPDIKVSGKFLFGGRILEIGKDGVACIKGRGDDVIKVRIAYDSPYFYARMRRELHNVPWEESLIEVRPVLDKDIVIGDFLKVAISQFGRNDKSYDENYQLLREMSKNYGILRGYLLEIYQ